MRLPKRLLRIVLYGAIAVVALSVCLRVYCAWHIPRAKRLMNDMSQLRAMRPFDDHLHHLIAEYGFRAADPDHCNMTTCDYQLQFGIPYPLSVIDRHSEKWLVDRILVPLGFHPWGVWAQLTIKSERLDSFNYSLGILDPTGYGVGAVVTGSPSLQQHFREDSPDLLIGELPRFKDHELRVFLSSEAGDTSFLKPSFSCVWNLRLCTSAYDVFPSAREYRERVEAHRKARLASDDPCPAQSTFERTRDSDLVWLGKVESAEPSQDASVRLEKVFKNEFGDQVVHLERVGLWDSSQLFFRAGLPKGQEVIVFENNSPDCNVVSASPENLAEIAKSLAAHPPADRSLPPPPRVAPMPTWQVPPGLR